MSCSTEHPMKQTAPFGTWMSLVTVDLVCSQSVSLSELSADGDDLFWLERRPGDKGRTTLVRRSGDGSIQDVSPPGEDVGSRVHEYGGGSYVAEAGRILWSGRRDGSVWLLDPQRGRAPVQVAA